MSEFFQSLYAYCTDFIINLANFWGISYYEVNFIIFVVLYPLAFVLTLASFVYYSMKLKKVTGHGT
jgi:hypothetical protein